MEIDELLRLIRKRRSIRTFKPDPIPDEYVEKIIEAARWAMSGANGQPWEFVIVKDPELRKKIVDIQFQEWKSVFVIESTRVKELRQPAFAKKPKELPGFKDAPVIIVVCGDPRTYQATVLATHFFAGDGNTYYKNLANATHNIHLAAAALGLGSQWISMTNRSGARVKALLGVPEEFDVNTIVPIGYPAYDPPPPYRRKLSEIMHFDRYDTSKFRSDEDIKEYILYLRQRTKAGYDAGFWINKSESRAGKRILEPSHSKAKTSQEAGNLRKG